MNDFRYHFLFTTFVSVHNKITANRNTVDPKCNNCPITVLFQDLETFDLEDFKYNSVNITSYRIVDDENHRVINVLREMERFQRVGQNMLHKSGIIRVINYNVFLPSSFTTKSLWSTAHASRLLLLVFFIRSKDNALWIITMYLRRVLFLANTHRYLSVFISFLKSYLHHLKHRQRNIKKKKITIFYNGDF